jgi:DNA-directed RNA polymerase subunit RPC12/RpoP
MNPSGRRRTKDDHTYTCKYCGKIVSTISEQTWGRCYTCRDKVIEENKRRMEESKKCQNCKSWATYPKGAPQGQYWGKCLRTMSTDGRPPAATKAYAVVRGTGVVHIAEEKAILVTATDFGCRQWEEREGR